MAITRYKVVRIDYMGRRKSLFVDSVFELTYRKGSIVRGALGTGVFVFDTLENARKFASGYSATPRGRYGATILRVRPIGRGWRPTFRPTRFTPEVIHRFWADPTATKKASKGEYSLAKHLELKTHSIAHNDGTIIYPAVRVLD